MGIEFNNEQIHALFDIENWWTKSTNQIYELSGAAGTGKTTLIRYFIDRIGLELKDVAFIAYQGKAAMQMARNGLPSQTIHSFIYNYEKVLDLDENGKVQFTQSGKPKTKLEFKLKDKLPRDVKLMVLDEGSMVNEKIAVDLLSFKVPLIVLGDLNQLPPVFGKPYFLENPDYVLTKVMRQAENDPIIWLSQRVLHDMPLQIGVYGKSSVISKGDLNEFTLNKSDIVLTGTNRLRHEVNTIFRENIKRLKKLELPNVGEKIICRRNDWNRCINDSIYLTNGTAGTVDYIDMESFNGKSIRVDFKPDFLNKKFKNVPLDYKRLFSVPGSTENHAGTFDFTRDQFEFAYAITVHLSQGSQYPDVLYLNERMGLDKSIYRKLQYTAITRASKSITIVL